MSYFKGAYLRVLSLRTTDGVNPLVIDEKLQYKEDFMPMTAKADLEKQNERLPDLLKKKIEVVGELATAKKK